MKKNRILALLLAVVMVIGMIPTAWATETEPTETTEVTEATVPETTAATTPVVVNETVPETTEATVPATTEATVPETTEATVPETTEATVPETTEATVPETTEATVPETTEETVPETTEETVPAELTKETDASGVTIQVSGSIPAEVTLSARYVREAGFFSFFGSNGPSFNTEIYDVISPLSEVAFAFDITLTNEDGTEWQPESGETVTVTLDVSPFEIEDGTNLGIAHDHNGTISKLGEYTVEGGKLTFETTGFSVFYGFTVDFEYDGTWYSISGGSDIYLSELFEIIGIEKSVNEVMSVEFSDDELISIGHFVYLEEEGGGQDWILKSLAPFTTEELLTITLASGETLEINVFDKAWDNENIDSNEIWDNGDTHGNRTVTENSTITIKDGATVTMNGYILVNPGVTLTIKCNGTATLVRGSKNTQPLFNVQGGTLKITDGQIILDGKKIVTNNPAILIGDYDNNSNVSTVDLSKVTIRNFDSTNGSFGGAISTRGGTKIGDTGSYNKPKYALTVTDCTIANCKARDGSAIYFQSNSRGNATITRTVIENCYATGHQNVKNGPYQEGGTIRSNGQNGSLVELNQCIIRNNQSISSNGGATYGGGIYWNAAADLPSDVTDSYTTSNKRAKMYIFDCQIYGNEATGSGGGIFNESSMEIGTKDSDGFITAPNAIVGNIKGTLIYGNTSGSNGGGIGIPSYGGGAADHQSMGVTMNLGKGVYLLNNEALNGGGLSMNIRDTADIGKGQTFAINYDGAVIQGNKATSNGGGIYIQMTTEKYIADLNLISGSISGNNAKNGGGIYVENTNINIGTEKTTTDNPIKIENNTASVDGGGIYLNQTTVYGNEAIINVSNGLITTNVATRNGGGIYQTGEQGNCIVSGEGMINNNTAANGGGIYVAGSSKLTVNGGIITENKAVCSCDDHAICEKHQDKTAYGSASGVGGGIYVADNSEFVMSKESGDVGLYGNLADFAADDAYASGEQTKLTIPGVGGMLIENVEFARLEGWFLDYYGSDSNFEKSSYSTNPGRYRATTGLKKLATKEGITNGTEFYCLTLGKTPALIIEKTIPGAAKPDQSFRFHLKDANGTNIDTWVTLNPDDFKLSENGKSMVATVTVGNVPTGDVTVTEDVAWSWRYKYDSCNVEGSSKQTAATNGVTIDMTTAGEKVTFTNSRDNIYWLDFEDVLSNIFNPVTKS